MRADFFSLISDLCNSSPAPNPPRPSRGREQQNSTVPQSKPLTADGLSGTADFDAGGWEGRRPARVRKIAGILLYWAAQASSAMHLSKYTCVSRHSVSWKVQNTIHTHGSHFSTSIRRAIANTLAMDISDEDALAWALAESLRMADVKQAEEAQLEEALRVSAAEEAQLEEVLRVSAAGVPVADKTPSTPEVIRVNSCASSRCKRQMNRRQRLQHIGVESESASPSPGKSETLSTTATSNKSVLSRSTSNVASFASSKRPPIAGRQPTSEHPSWHLPEMPPISSTQLALPDRARGHKAAVAPVLCWLRQEMRLEDNRALAAAAATGRPVIPLYVHPAEGEEGGFPLVGAAMYWQHHSLNNLQHALASPARTGYAKARGVAASAATAQGPGRERRLLQLVRCEPVGKRDAEICRVLADSGFRTLAMGCTARRKERRAARLCPSGGS